MMFWGWALIAPTLIGLLVLNIIPMIQTLVMSFQNVSTFGESTWVHFDNYIRMIGDPKVWQSLKNTLLYGLVQVPITVILSTIAAVLVNQKIKGVQEIGRASCRERVKKLVGKMIVKITKN